MAESPGKVFKRLLYQEIPGKDLGVPADELGPTKNMFLHRNMYSTHLNVSDDKKFFPLLVPNQVGVDALLYGAKATPEQYARAKASAARDPASTVPFPPGVQGGTAEAAKFEKEWHDKLEKNTDKPLLRAVQTIMGVR